MQVDVETDEIVFTHLRASGAVKTASSEEQTKCQDMGGNGFSVRSLQWHFCLLIVTIPNETAQQLKFIDKLMTLPESMLAAQL